MVSVLRRITIKRLCLAALTLLAFFLGTALFILIGRAREAACESQCHGNLYQLGFALQCYHERYGSLPPAYLRDKTGRPAHSWRILIDSIMVATSDPNDVGDIFQRYHFDKPWNDPKNRRLEDECRIFFCPSDPHAADTPRTSYVAVIGEDTAWPGHQPRKLADPRRLSEDLILLVEIPETDIHWMEPRDITFEQAMRLYAPGNGPSGKTRHAHGLHYIAIGPEGLKFGTFPFDLEPVRLAAMLRVAAVREHP